MAESSGSASYHGLVTTVEKRLSHGTQGSVSYTWSHSLDNVTEQSGAEGNMIIQDWRNIQGDRGNSGFDRRHRLVAHALIDLPFGADRRWLRSGGIRRALFTGWQISGIVSAQSGAPFDVEIADAANRLGVTPGAACGDPISSGILECPIPPPMPGSTPRRSPYHRTRMGPIVSVISAGTRCADRDISISMQV